MKSRCAACKKRITKGEPDLVLCRMREGMPGTLAREEVLGKGGMEP